MTESLPDVFCQACVDGDLETLRELLQIEPHLVNVLGQVAPAHRDFMRHSSFESGWTPLHLAARYARAEVVQLLIEAGADINRPAENGVGSTPLMVAVASGKEAIMKLLLDAGANPLLRDKSGFTAVTLAEEASRYDIAGVLRDASKALQAQPVEFTPTT